jgi:hypothetical protein
LELLNQLVLAELLLSSEVALLQATFDLGLIVPEILQLVREAPLLDIEVVSPSDSSIVMSSPIRTINTKHKALTLQRTCSLQ